MWFDVKPQSLDFVTRSPSHMHFDAAIYAPPERVFDVVASDDMGAWLPDFREMRWTSPPPRKVGSTRVVSLKMLAVKEIFLAWDRGRRLTFTMDAITLPIVDALVEDIKLEPFGPRHTRVRYGVHYTPKLWARPIEPIIRAVFGKLFRDALRGIARVAVSETFTRTPEIHA